MVTAAVFCASFLWEANTQALCWELGRERGSCSPSAAGGSEDGTTGRSSRGLPPAHLPQVAAFLPLALEGCRPRRHEGSDVFAHVRVQRGERFTVTCGSNEARTKALFFSLCVSLS